MKNFKTNLIFLIIPLIIIISIKALNAQSYDVILIGENSISYCNEFGIKSFFKNITSNSQTSITMVELNFLSLNQINFEQIKCLGRIIVFSNNTNNTIYIGFDTFVYNFTILFFKLLIIFIFYKKIKLLFLSNLFNDLFIIFFFSPTLNLNFLIFFNFYIYFYIYLNKTGFLKYFPNNYPKKIQKQLSFVSLFLIFILIVYKLINFEYMIGYWLANYKYGFIRRGLMGHILLTISNFSNFKLTIVINSFLIICYFILFFYVFKFFNLKERSYNSYLILFSPAFLLYYIFDNNVVGRPEILGLLTFLFYLDKKDKSIKIILATTLFLIISIFSHSFNLFVIPFLIIEILIRSKFKIVNFITILEIILYPLVGFLFLLFFTINPQNIDYVIENLCIDALSLSIRDDICNGAIGWLNESFGGQLKMSEFWSDRQNIYYLSYILTFAFSLIPFGKKFNLISKLQLSIVLFSLLPFFYIQYDWGRTINIFIFYISFKFFQNENYKIDLNKKFNSFHILVYSSIWYLPVARGYRIDNIFLNLDLRLISSLIIICLIYFFNRLTKKTI